MDAVSGSVGAVVRLLEEAAPYASISTAFETPTTTEIVNRPDGGGGLNPNIEPQHTTSYELGMRGRVRGWLTYDVAVFQADVRDELIPFEDPSEPGRRFFRNAGSARHRGAEIGVSARLPGGVSALAAYTGSDLKFREFRTADETFDGNTIPGVPRHRFHWSVRYDGPNGLWGALDNTHTSSYYVDDANSVQVASWFATGVRVGWEWKVSEWRVAPFVSVLNLFDRSYVGSVVVNARFGRYFEPAPGRNLILGLAIEPLN